MGLCSRGCLPPLISTSRPSGDQQQQYHSNDDGSGGPTKKENENENERGEEEMVIGYIEEWVGIQWE